MSSDQNTPKTPIKTNRSKHADQNTLPPQKNCRLQHPLPPPFPPSLIPRSSNTRTPTPPQDCIDFHYRIKIPNQYRKYQDKKALTKAAEAVEEPIGAGAERGGVYQKTTNKSVLEQRHKNAKTYLQTLRSSLGEEMYLSVVSLLKSYGDGDITVKMLRDRVMSVLGDESWEGFRAFLPKKYRN